MSFRAGASCLVLMCLLSAAGCLSTGQYPEENEQWNEKRWQQAILDDQQRLLPEDQRANRGLWPAFDKAAKAVSEAVVHLYNYITGRTPFNAAKDLLDPSHPDRRREAVVYLSKRPFGRQPPYTTYYAEMARNDDDPTVRAMAIRALNRSRDKSQIPLYIQALEDPHYLVRLEAAKALANMPDERATQSLIRHLEGRIEIRVRQQMESQEEQPDVRVACADALRGIRRPEAAQALVRALRDRDFAVCWQARVSLRLMTGKDFRYDQAAWLRHLSGPSGGA